MKKRRAIDPEATREAILAAALALFSERGYGATSVRDVAERAGVAKSLVLYHFASKELLWTTTIESHIRPLVGTFLRYAQGDPTLTFRGLLRARFEFMRTHPHIPRLMAWLTLEPAPFPGPIDEIAPRVIARAKAELAGTPHPPEILAALALGAVDGWFRYRGLYERLAHIPAEDGAADDQFLETLLQLLPEATS
jgi:AcrR family transcriptional regulator